MKRPWLFTGQVYHERFVPLVHAFRYPALFLCFPLAERAQMRNALFGVNRWNLFAYHDADHGDGGDPEAWLRHILSAHRITAPGPVYLLTQPRILGFVFNPVSFWYCHDEAGLLRAVLCEVNNTFGERHGYLLRAEDGGEITEETWLTCAKCFHVSPFFPVQGHYRFRFRPPSERTTVAIDYFQDQTLMLKTAISGQAQEFNARALWRCFWGWGWATALMVIRIHWQALILWRKGAHFHRKPEAPSKEITL